MTFFLLTQSIRRAPRRLLLAITGVAFPVAMLAATLLFVDTAVLAMTQQALGTVQIEMRALATSLNVDTSSISQQLAAVPGVRAVDRFAATDVVVGTPGAGQVTARLFAIDPSYAQNHPWLHIPSGHLSTGAVLDESLLASPGFQGAKSVSIDLLGGRPLSLSLPVTGTADLRDAASTWFAIPTGPVQGDIAAVPRAIVIDYPTFERSVLPALRAEFGTTQPILNPGSTDLAPVSLELHVAVDHSAYPADPGSAAVWSGRLRRVLETTAPPGSIVVGDNTAEVLTEAKVDATNAKILFILLGIPAVIVAAALGFASESALAEAGRREEALLRLRGATDSQLTRLAIAQAGVATLFGATVGIAVAVAAVNAATGIPVWRSVSISKFAFAAILATMVGAATMAIRAVRLRRASRQSQVIEQRRHLEKRWAPGWLKARLDIVFILIGAAILFVFVRSGGLRQSPIEGQTLALSFYLLLAPIFLWLGCTLLVLRGLLSLIVRRARPGAASRTGTSWRRTSLRWLGRRPSRAAVAISLGALAVAFGTEVVTFAATYQSAKLADAQVAFGSDLRLTPAVADTLLTLPPLGNDVSSTTPFNLIPARAGTDRKTILGIDLASYSQTATVAPDMLSGQGISGLVNRPNGVLIAKEIASDFEVKPGDSLPLTVFPDDLDKTRNMNFHVVGVFRSFPPTFPTTEMVMSSSVFPTGYLPPPDFYLARVAPGLSPNEAAPQVQAAVHGTFDVSTIQNLVNFGQRSLTALNLSGLSKIEAFGAALIAAVGVALLGAFMVLERRREFAILSASGADKSQILTGPILEGTVTVAASLLIGIPVGLGLGALSVRVLGLFFQQPPPFLTVPVAALIGLAVLVVIASVVALGFALVSVARVSAAKVLREA